MLAHPTRLLGQDPGIGSPSGRFHRAGWSAARVPEGRPEGIAASCVAEVVAAPAGPVSTPAVGDWTEVTSAPCPSLWLPVPSNLPGSGSLAQLEFGSREPWGSLHSNSCT